jgi:hypothetical protein
VLLALLALWPFHDASVGTAKHYSPGLMARVYQVRIRQGLVKAGWHAGLASTPYCQNIGRVLSASFLDPHTHAWTYYRPLLVVDCAQNRDRPGQVARGLVVETDYSTAFQTGWARDGKTRAIVEWR